MDPSKANPPQEYQRQREANESLAESIRALRHLNALAPISSLPTEVITAIFSCVRHGLLGTSPLVDGKPGCLAWLRVAQVCHRWREIALIQPRFWSHVDFAAVSPTVATGMLSRARMAPLYLELRVPRFRWDGARFSEVQKELQAHTFHICHLTLSADSFHLRSTFNVLTSPAPILEFLSLSRSIRPMWRTTVPKTLFDGITPRLSCLKLCECNISWKSPLLKGLKHLEVLNMSASARPSLAVWLNALDEMPHLKTLVLHSASPVARFPSDLRVERTVTLPFLTDLNISASVGDCALALAHLVLPALTRLCLMAASCRQDGSSVQLLLPYVTRHAHGPQDTQPLQSVLIHSKLTRIDIIAWPMPDIDFEEPRPFPVDTVSARVVLSIVNEDWRIRNVHVTILEAAIAALPLDSLITLATQGSTRLNEQFWLRHAPRWPLLKHLRLTPPAARGLSVMLLQDNGLGSPLLPSMTTLALIGGSALSAFRTHRLCDVLMQRVEQGVPLEVLDVRMCIATSVAIQLLSEIVVNVLGPAKTQVTEGPFVCDSPEDYSDDGHDEDDVI